MRHTKAQGDTIMAPDAPQTDEAPARIGLLTPSSNTILEPATQALVAPMHGRVSVHFNRIRVMNVGLDPRSDAQFADAPALAAAELLADACPDIIAWNGTSASWRGLDNDRRLCADIETRTGVASTSAMMAYERLFATMGIRRLGLVTPYTADIQQAIVANLSGIGVEVTAETHCDLADNLAIGSIPGCETARLCRLVAASHPDAVAIVCTNMRGALLAGELEAELGIPVLDSVAVTLWGCLAKLGIDATVLAPQGRIFAQRAGEARAAAHPGPQVGEAGKIGIPRCR